MLLQTLNLTKQFASKTALYDVSISFQKSRIHSIVGENGAGKSTLVKILSDKIDPSSGKVEKSDSLNICIVQQRPLIAESITVRENIFLGCKETSEKKNLLETLRKKWCPTLIMDTVSIHSSGAERFYTSLLNCLLREPDVLILDEPGAYLDDDERENLFCNLDELKNDGMCIIIITHSKKEMIKYSDDIHLLKSGKLVESFIDVQTKNESEKKKIIDVIETSIGKITSEIDTVKSYEKIENCNVSMQVKNLEVRPKDKPMISDISFSVEAGKVLMIRGLSEAGLYTLEDCITGMSVKNQKGMFVFAKSKTELKVKNVTPFFLRKTLKKKIGLHLAIVPSDKAMRGSNPELKISDVLYGINGTAEDLIKKAQINAKSSDKVSSLSGGMLQKLILERELSYEPDIIIFCQPFAGLDMQKTHDMCRRIDELRKNGKAVLILSSENAGFEICDTIMKLEGGKLYA